MNRSSDRGGLPPFDAAWEEAYYKAAGLKRLSPVWAKAEIVIGLACAVGGLKLLFGEGMNALMGGALMVLGLYLAMAGNRSHLYQSQNRQAAYILHASVLRQPGIPIEIVGTG